MSNIFDQYPPFSVMHLEDGLDSISSGRAFAVAGGIAFDTGKHNNAAGNFSTSNYLQRTGASFAGRSGALLSAWIKVPSSGDVAQHIFYIANYCEVFLQNGYVNWQVRGSGDWAVPASSVNVPNNQWVHVMVGAWPGIAKISVNGVVQTFNIAFDTFSTIGATDYIGVKGDTYPFSGQIDEMYLWDGGTVPVSDFDSLVAALYAEGNGLFYGTDEPVSNIPTDGLIFYASLSSDATVAETGQTLTNNGVSYVTDESLERTVAMFNGSANMGFDTAGLPSGTTPHSKSLWLYLSSASAQTYVMAFGIDGNNTASTIAFRNGNWAWCFGGGWDDTPAAVPVGRWFNIVTTHDNGINNLYVDGVLTNTIERSLSVYLASGMLGSYLSGSEKFSGSMASVRIYNRVLNPDEINALYNEFTDEPTPAGSGLYLAPSGIVPKAGTPGIRFGNIFVPIAKPLPPIPTGGLVFYASLSSNAATAETGQALNINGVTFTADSTLGTTVGIFNGSSSYITFSDAGFPIGNAASTVSAWILINSISDKDCVILGYGANLLNQMRCNTVLANGALNQAGAWSASNSLSTAPGVCPSSEWVHVAFVNIDGLIKFYVNGNDVGIQSYARETVLSMGSIGSYYGGLEGFLNGRMSSLRVYNRELNADEIAALAKEFK